MRYQLLQSSQDLSGWLKVYRVWQEDGRVQTVHFLDGVEILRIDI